jgi:hypothetical protein
MTLIPKPTINRAQIRHLTCSPAVMDMRVRRSILTGPFSPQHRGTNLESPKLEPHPEPTIFFKNQSIQFSRMERGIPQASSAQPYHRDSQFTSSNKFSGLTSQKRNSSDEVAEARKSGFYEQKAGMTFFGRKWHE